MDIDDRDVGEQVELTASQPPAITRAQTRWMPMSGCSATP
jgi:hypothetical protein